MTKQRKRKKKTKPRLTLFFVFLSAIGIGGLLWYITNLLSPPVHYGIRMPKGFTVHGIDISQYQGRINWDTVCRHQDEDVPISFVYMRATMGLRTDKTFKENWQKTGERNLKRGAYLFFHPNKNGARQADLYIQKVGSLNQCLPPVVDIEKTYRMDKRILRSRLQECLDRLEAHYGIQPVIYTYTTFYRDFLGSDFDHYPLWIAHYEREDHPDYIDRPWDIWQHNEKGKIKGIEEYVDFNVLSEESSFGSFFHKNVINTGVFWF